MSPRRLLAVLVVLLALVMPATALANGGNPYANTAALSAALTGDAEVQPGDPDGFGFARVTLDLTTFQLCYQLSAANVGTPVAAHIHRGAAGTNGPVVVPFEAPSTGMSRGCVAVTPNLAVAIAADPAGYYVNVHTAEYPAGAVRGQLSYVGKQRPALPSGPIVTTIAEGLTSPRGIDIGPDGAVYLLDNGTGDLPDRDDECIVHPEAGPVCLGPTGRVLAWANGELTTVAANLPPFTADVSVSDSGEIAVIVGFGGNPDERAALGDLGAGLGELLAAGPDGFTVLADVAGYEVTANPHPEAIDSNPFAVTRMGDGYLVADAGGNDVLHVDADGNISTFAVFPDQMADAPPFLELPPGTQIPMQSVPTSIVQGPDGAYYVGELTGFPFAIGAARIWRLEDLNGDGDALDDGETTVFATGFTNVLDIGFDSAGRLLVLEITKNGLLAAEDPENEDPNAYTGALIRVEADGSHTELMSDGLVMPTGMAIAADDSIYISNFGVMPGMGQVIKVSLIEP